jgi:hypothetical protein
LDGLQVRLVLQEKSGKKRGRPGASNLRSHGRKMYFWPLKNAICGLSVMVTITLENSSGEFLF